MENMQNIQNDSDVLDLSSESIGELALGLLNRLDDDERKQLEKIITPEAARLLAKAFGPQFWSLLSPLLVDDLAEENSGGENQIAEEELRSMMRDPRYWRDRDSDLVRKVSDGFRRLYPE